MKKEKKRKQIQTNITQNESIKLRSNTLKSDKNQKPRDSISHEPSILDKELDQRKIIKEFQMKRKLLMKALKQKQKEKNPTLITIDMFQIKEGESKKCQFNQFDNNQKTDKINSQISSRSKPSSSMLLQPTKGMAIQKEAFGKKINVGIQSINFSGKTKKIKKNANQEAIKILKTPIDSELIKKRNKEILEIQVIRSRAQQKLTAKKEKPNVRKDIEKIKQQVGDLFNRKQPQNSNSNDSKNFSLLSFSSHSENSRQTQHLQISSMMQKLNKEIENYYQQKPLKVIILHKFRQRFKKISKKHKSLQKQFGRTKFNSFRKILKSKCSKSANQPHKSINYIKDKSSTKDEQKNVKQNQRPAKNRHYCINYSIKPINQRFKLALVENQDFRQNVAKLKLKKRGEQQRIFTEKQKSQSEESKSNFEKSFEKMSAWKDQFKKISEKLFQKFPSLKAYITQDKRFDYQRIYKRIRTQAREMENKRYQRRKRIRKESPQMNENENSIQKYSSRNRTKYIRHNGFKRYKQLRIGKKEEDEFGKSFQHHQFPGQNFEQNFTFGEFYRQSESKHKSDEKKQYVKQQQFDKKNRTVNSKQKSKSSSSQFFKSESSVSQKKIDNSRNPLLCNNKTLVHPVEEWSLFRGQKDKEYLYMSEEFL